MITLRNVLGGVPLVVERASATALKDTVTWSGWYHRREPRALVLVWPTTGGIFAWQPGAPEALNEAQLPSWREAIVHTGGVAAVPIWAFPVPEDHVCLTCRHVLEEEVPILWVARESHATRGEDWSLHRGAAGHQDSEVRAIHLAHLVRSAPSVTATANLPLDHEAWRDDVDADKQTGPLQR
jgi:hypothetical protein